MPLTKPESFSSIFFHLNQTWEIPVTENFLLKNQKIRNFEINLLLRKFEISSQLQQYILAFKIWKRIQS